MALFARVRVRMRVCGRDCRGCEHGEGWALRHRCAGCGAACMQRKTRGHARARDPESDETLQDARAIGLVD